LDWPEIESAVDELSSHITRRPDCIVGVVRGGLVPARLLASRLDVKTMYALTVKKRGGDRIVVTRILDNLKGQQVLLVEDMLESGTSLIEAKQYLESLGAAVETFALYIQPGSLITPDYYLSKRTEVPHFPWE
jgi:hypoxanthine phosphoribosyltransferase